MALLNKVVALGKVAAAGLLAAACQGCAPSATDETAGSRPDSGPASASASAGDEAGAGSAGAAAAGQPAGPAAAGPAALPSIPQYRRVAPPPGGVGMEIGLMGRVRIRDGCVLVIDRAGASVLPVFPSGAEWTVPGKELRAGGRTVRDGEQVVWSVEQTERDFRQGRPAQSGEQDIPAHCTASRYVLVA
jgi:hypothetical protein